MVPGTSTRANVAPGNILMFPTETCSGQSEHIYVPGNMFMLPGAIVIFKPAPANMHLDILIFSDSRRSV